MRHGRKHNSLKGFFIVSRKSGFGFARLDLVVLFFRPPAVYIEGKSNDNGAHCEGRKGADDIRQKKDEQKKGCKQVQHVLGIKEGLQKSIPVDEIKGGS